MPQGQRSVGCQQKTNGGHANFIALTKVIGQTGQDRVDLLLDTHVINILIFRLDEFRTVYLLGSDEGDALEWQNGADALGGVVEFAVASDDGQQDGNNLLDAEGSDGGQGNDSVVKFSAGLELFGKNGQELVDDDGTFSGAEIGRRSESFGG